MVLRSSPWESRTPPATKGHFARGGPLRESGGGLLFYIQGLCSTWNGGRGDLAVPSAPYRHAGGWLRSAPEAREEGRDGALGEGRHAVRGAADGGVHAAPAQGRVPVDLRLRVGNNHVVKLQTLGNA